MMDREDDKFLQTHPKLAPLCERLTELSAELSDDVNSWPKAQLNEVAQAGVMGWVIPTEYGGCELTAKDLTRGYLHLTQACLTTSFILTPAKRGLPTLGRE